MIVNSSTSLSAQHIPLMNAIFEAQRQRIKIDVIKSSTVEGEDVLLKQAAAITGGYFLQSSSPDSLLGLMELLSLGQRFADDQAKYCSLLSLPQQSGTDFRGSCICHGKLVQVGYVCSVCLSGKR